MENVYIALIINKNNYPNFSQYNKVIDLFNQKYPNNSLVFDDLVFFIFNVFNVFIRNNI